MARVSAEQSMPVLAFSGRRARRSERAAAEPVVQELTLGGRRYRLVPVDGAEASAPLPAASELLTPRELQIVVLVGDGLVNKQIADVLRISEWTVSTHLRRIFAKLSVDTRTAMVSRCYRIPNPSSLIPNPSSRIPDPESSRIAGPHS